MRLLRDQVPGVGHRYIQFAPGLLVAALEKHSPISQAGEIIEPDCLLENGTSGDALADKASDKNA
jgi:hypothetical protein